MPRLQAARYGDDQEAQVSRGFRSRMGPGPVRKSPLLRPHFKAAVAEAGASAPGGRLIHGTDRGRRSERKRQTSRAVRRRDRGTMTCPNVRGGRFRGLWPRRPTPPPGSGPDGGFAVLGVRMVCSMCSKISESVSCCQAGRPAQSATYPGSGTGLVSYFLRLVAWSACSGITVLMFRLRR